MLKHAMFGVGLAVAVAGTARADWGPGDELGNGNTQGFATRLRCVEFISSPRAKMYEIGRPYSQTMPQALFGDGPVSITYKPTQGLPFTRHAANGEVMTAGFGSQGTQMDALGHFGVLDAPYFGGPFPADLVHYYGGFTQADVKPTPESPMLHLGIDKAPPIMTSAVLLDAAALRGRPLEAGELITADDIVAMLQNQKLAKRGILAGDAVYIHTGWGAQWQDPAPDPAHTPYYLQGPGLSVDAQQYLAQRTIVLIALDNPFTDPFRPCEVDGSCPPPAGTAPGLPFNVHHNDLTQDGIYQIQNLKLDEMAADRTWLSCTVILPLRLVGAVGSAVRPIAVGVPAR